MFYVRTNIACIHSKITHVILNGHYSIWYKMKKTTLSYEYHNIE